MSLNKKKALALFSGGLDSALAIAIIKEQNIDVLAIYIKMGFDSRKDTTSHLQKMCKQLGVEFEILDVGYEYIKEVLFTPKYGYGKNFNPCIDCHAFMFRQTSYLLKKYNADFMISGEVLAQRPMSQNKIALSKVATISGAQNFIVRPLSARLLEPSYPELQGWVDREKLYGISGRSRSQQESLAKKFKILDYPSSAGGCLLTQTQFSHILRDFVKYDTLEKYDVDILKFGRHLRLSDSAKLIIGRNKEDNERLQNAQNECIKHTNTSKFNSIVILDTVGGYSLISKGANADDIELACKIIITYAKSQPNKSYKLQVEGMSEPIIVTPFQSLKEIREYLVNK